MEHNALELVRGYLQNLKGEDGRIGSARTMNARDVDGIEKILDYCGGNLNQFINL